MINNEKIVTYLVSVLKEKSPNYLKEKPYELYLNLIDKNICNKDEASKILYLCTSGILDNLYNNLKEEVLIDYIERVCGLNYDVAYSLADILRSIFTDENIAYFKENEFKGLKEFKEDKEFHIRWEGVTLFDAGNVYMQCDYNAEITLVADENFEVSDDLERMLKSNPLMSKEAIAEYYKGKLCDYLDKEFDGFCNADPYNGPWCDDFDIEDSVAYWAKKYHFEVIECDGEGENGSYQPFF